MCSSKDYISNSEIVGMVRACRQFKELSPSIDLVCACICEAYSRFQVIGQEISAFDRMCLTLRYSEFGVNLGGSTDIEGNISADSATSVAFALQVEFCNILGFSSKAIMERLSDYGLK